MINIAGKYCIVGVGNTKYGKLPGRSPESLCVEAIRNACLDAGLDKNTIDAVVTKEPTSAPSHLFSTRVAQQIGVIPKVTTTLDQAGASNIGGVAYAMMMMELGLCTVAAVAFGDNPITGSRATYSRPSGEWAPYGLFAAVSGYALTAQRYLQLYDKKNKDMAPWPLGDRKWAAMNPNACYQKPMTLADHQASRWVVEPLHLFDCTSIQDGAAAVLVTSVERARDLKSKPIYVHGYGQGHIAWDIQTRPEYLVTGAKYSGEQAFKQAGITAKDVDFCELYDCFSIVPILTLEDYGFCKKGEGCDFIADNKTHPGGALPCNTSGGLLSETGMPGMQLIVEGVRQARGECGQRQIPKHRIGVVSNQGGQLHTHSTLVLSTEAKL
ncbi:MAG: thiolase family protein [Candidatus Lambdaproteobacteria bacterium]|nr:thiolase family protein [Candidatus Lambdaproteobacteria bacterium]